MNKIIIKIVFLLLFLPSIKSEDKESIALSYFMQGQYLMNQGNYALAVIEFQDALLLDPNAGTLHISIAEAYRNIGKDQRSLNHLLIALELNPVDKEALKMIGQLFISQKNFEEAEKYFLKLNKIEPENLDFLYILADLSRLKKQWNTAIDYYIEIYKVNPSETNSLQQALQISISTGNMKRSDEICELLINNDPDNLDLLETQRDIAFYNKDYNKALTILSTIEKKQGPSSKIFIQKSSLYEQLKQPDLAIKVMYDAFKYDSLNIEVLQRLVTLLMDQELNEEAVLINESIIDNFPDDPRGFINYALMALSKKEPEDAIDGLGSKSDQFPEDFMVQYLLGTSYYQIKDYENAELYLSKALEIFPNSRNTKHNLALIYDIKNEWEKSDQLYLELIDADSLDAQAFNNYAYSLVERNENIELALELSKSAIIISPTSAPYLDTIGWIYFKMNRLDEAIKYIKDSLSIDKNNPIIREHLDEVIKAKSELNY
jgi:tetratricopeptide (TPR) repeat protein